LTGDEFLWNEAAFPRPCDGQVLIRTLWLSVDPAQRTWMARDSYKPAVPLGDVMQSFAVGQVLESRLPDFKRGDLVRGEFGWQDYAVTDGKSFGGMQKVPPGIPPNLALGLFGLNGLTAYIGKPAILDRDLFGAVQAKLNEQRNNHTVARSETESLLIGRISSSQ
jgi:NADPH-dependent curcumin reductase